MEVAAGFRSGAEIAEERFTWDEYQQLAARTANGLPDRMDRVENALLGLTGELGELSEPIKHARFHGHPFDVDHFREEAGDLLWYISWICSEYDIRLSKLADTQSIREFQRTVPKLYVHSVHFSLTSLPERDSACSINQYPTRYQAWTYPRRRRLMPRLLFSLKYIVRHSFMT